MVNSFLDSYPRNFSHSSSQSDIVVVGRGFGRVKIRFSLEEPYTKEGDPFLHTLLTRRSKGSSRPAMGSRKSWVDLMTPIVMSTYRFSPTLFSSLHP